MSDDKNGMSLLDRLCALRGGRLSPIREGFPLANGEGGNKGCELASRSSIGTSPETWSEIEVDGESRKGDGLNGGNVSKLKIDGCDRDLE